MDANLQSDFTVVEGFLRKIYEMVEAVTGQNAMLKLSEKLLKYYNHTHQLYFRTVPAQYAEEVREKLLQHAIPMMCSRDSAGNMVFMLPEDSGENAYGHLFDEVFMHHPEYYKQLEASTWCRLAKYDGIRGTVVFTFTNSVDAEIFKNKAFAEGKGVVTTDIVNRDGSVSVVVRENEMINETEYHDAVDAYIDAELSLGGREQGLARRFAVLNDVRQTDLCMDYIDKDIPFVVHNGADKRSDFIEFADGKFYYYTFDKTSLSFTAQEIRLDGINRDEVRKFLERHMSYIHNATVCTADEFEQFQGQSDAYIREQYTDRQKLLYTEVILKCAKNEEYINHLVETTGTDRDEAILLFCEREAARYGVTGIRPDFSKDFLLHVKGELEEEMNGLEDDARERTDSARADITRRLHGFREGLMSMGIEQINEIPVMDASLDGITEYLAERHGFCAARIREEFGLLPKEGYPDDAHGRLKYLASSGVRIPNAARANELYTKSSLTPDEKAEFMSILEESEMRYAVTRKPELAAIYKELQGITAKRIELNGLYEFRREKQTEIDGIRRTTEEMKNDRLSTIKELEKIIRMEINGKNDVEHLQRGCHDMLHDLKVRNPDITVPEIMRHVKEYLKENGVQPTHMTVEYMGLDRFEYNVKTRQEERERTQDNTWRGFYERTDESWQDRDNVPGYGDELPVARY